MVGGAGALVESAIAVPDDRASGQPAPATLDPAMQKRSMPAAWSCASIAKPTLAAQAVRGESTWAMTGSVSTPADLLSTEHMLDAQRQRMHSHCLLGRVKTDGCRAWDAKSGARKTL
jgi:hypothetical protein